MTRPRILIIVPCFNEESRIDLPAFLETACDAIQFLFVNDGSTDRTGAILKEASVRSNSVHVCDVPVNCGKGNAILFAYKSSWALRRQHAFDYIGYWDADLSTPLYEISSMLEYLLLEKKRRVVNAVFGSRVPRLGANISRTVYRRYLSRIFAFFTSCMLRTKFFDSQCGAKLFDVEAAEDAFAMKFMSRWGFDLEILLRLGQQRVIEYPLQEWHDVPGGKVRVLQDAFSVAWDIYKMRRYYVKRHRVCSVASVEGACVIN